MTGFHRDAAYTFENGYRYYTDEHGRVDLIDASLRLEPSGRNQAMQVNAGGAFRRTTDEGGHSIDVRFNGPAHEANHIAQDIKLNRGQFKALENQWAADLKAGRSVNVKIKLEYSKDSIRPAELKVSTTVDGVNSKPKNFKNER